MPAFLRTFQAAEASEASQLAFEFLILTVARTSELLLATWSEVDLDTRTWTIPGARMKSGRAHSVPRASRVLEILHRAKGLSVGGPYVFPGRAPTRPLWNMVFLILLRRLQRDHLTVHGFRSTFRDWAAERTNVPRAVCEAVLAHTLRDKAEVSYNRTDLFARRRELSSTCVSRSISRGRVSIRRNLTRLTGSMGRDAFVTKSLNLQR